MRQPSLPGLRSLARLYSIQTSYFDVQGTRIQASEETLLLLLKALGVSVNSAEDVEAARRNGALARLQVPVEPVIVAWDGQAPVVEVRIPAGASVPSLSLESEVDDTASPDDYVFNSTSKSDMDVEGQRFHILHYECRTRIPPGYYALHWKAAAHTGQSLLVSAPSRCYGADSDVAWWGLFAPLYALRSENDWGSGSYTELERLSRWAYSSGGHLVGTLPILPCFYDTESEPSPYVPVTRLLWSEFFVDVDGIDFLPQCSEANSLISDNSFLALRGRLSNAELVDYHEVLALKRQVLEKLAHYAWYESASLASELRRFVSSHPRIKDYSAFRAMRDKSGLPWQEWAGEPREGALSPDLAHNDVARYHQFVQWVAHKQVEHLTTAPDSSALYLDLPVGVHPEGYDAWRYKSSHLFNVSCGAPPDLVFTQGQSWLAPPLHPITLRETGYRYWQLCLQHHMSHCDVLRIDHVMGLHRMFCIPDGVSAAKGTYVRYRPDEMYAIVSLESHRNSTAVVGEDLGTVPGEVQKKMSRHGLNRMFVLYYEMPHLESEEPLKIPSDSLASISTHDMPPFAAIWRDVDIDEQARIGIMAPNEAPSARRERASIKNKLVKWLRTRAAEQPGTDETSVLHSVLSWLAASRARYVIANMEDFWLETRQPNVPGAGPRYPNWTQRMPFTLEQIERDSRVLRIIGILRGERARRRTARKGVER